MVIIKRRKILFLISEESDNFYKSIKIIKKLISTGCDLTVISLSVLTSMELKKCQIDYKTPNFYMNKLDFDEIDKVSLKFAKNWYKPFENEIIYDGISLGEMLEYNFYFLFVDAIRCVEIGKEIFLSEKPDSIYLPLNLKMNDPNFLCYEALPKVILSLSDQHNIQYIVPNSLNNENILHITIPISNIIFNLFFNFYTKLVNYYQIYILPHLYRDVILFWNAYEYQAISGNLKILGYHTNRIYPFKVSNRFSVEKRSKINSFNIELENCNYSNINISYKGLDLAYILKNRIEEAFDEFEDLVEYLEWAKLFTRNFPQGVLISMEDVTPIKRLIVRWFRINNLPSIIIQHGLVTKDMSGFGIMPIEANKQAVWGDYSLNWHIKRGNDAQVITGNPVFDQISQYKNRSKRETIIKKLRLDMNKKIILITTERFAGITSGYTIEDEEEKIRNTIKSLKNFVHQQLIIKLHPGHQDHYKRIIFNISKEEDIDLIIFTEHYWDLIFICDVLITFTSTTGLEAMLFEKPVIIIGSEDEVDCYTSHIMSIGVTDFDELNSVIKDILYGKTFKNLFQLRDKLVYQSNYLNDGKASKRIAKLIIYELTT